MVVDAVAQFFDRHHITGRVVAACSGGVDSTALLLALADLNVDLVCGHVNHHLRGDESDGDEQFVRQLCARLDIPFAVADGTLPDDAVRRCGVEGAARDTRIDRLQQIRCETGARYIATAHQRNDQTETVLMRVFTGTGIAGMRGIHPVRDDGIIRPLLEVPRHEIESFLAAKGVRPRFDRSNADPRFLRNRVRALLQGFSEAEAGNVAAIAAQAQMEWNTLESVLNDFDKTTHVTANEARFTRMPQDMWIRQALLHRHIRRLGPSREVSSRDLERLASAIDSLRRVSVTGELELLRDRGSIVLRRVPEPAEDFEFELAAGESFPIEQIKAVIHLRRAAHPDPEDRRREIMSSSTQRFQISSRQSATFTVRNRRRGDRFQPLGMRKDKKLKDFLIDRKIPAEVRGRIPLLIFRGEIVWVAGVEISERFKVTGGTAETYEVVLEHEEDRNGLQR